MKASGQFTRRFLTFFPLLYRLVDLGYEAIMKTATESPRAVLEAMPGRSNMSQAAAAIELENIRARVFFGAFEKYEQPLQNLLAAAKRGSLPNADPYDTMIVPAGLPGTTKPELPLFSLVHSNLDFLSPQTSTSLRAKKRATTFSTGRRRRSSTASSSSFPAVSTMLRRASRATSRTRRPTTRRAARSARA